MYFVTGSKVRIHAQDGKVRKADGYLMAHEAWTHRVENIGDRDLKAIIFKVMP